MLSILLMLKGAMYGMVLELLLLKKMAATFSLLTSLSSLVAFSLSRKVKNPKNSGMLLVARVNTVKSRRATMPILILSPVFLLAQTALDTSSAKKLLIILKKTL